MGAAPEDLERVPEAPTAGTALGLSSATRPLRRRVTDSQLVGDRIEASVSRPYACPCDYDRGEQVGVDPSNPTPLQFPAAYEFDDFPVRNGRDLRQCIVAREQRGTAAPCPDEQLSEHQLVREHLLAVEESIERTRERLAPGEESNPHRGVDEDDHATRGFLRRVGRELSRRRGTSRAAGSVPRSARKR